MIIGTRQFESNITLERTSDLAGVGIGESCQSDHL